MSICANKETIIYLSAKKIEIVFLYLSVISNSVVSGCGRAAYSLKGDPCEGSDGHIPEGRSINNEARSSMYGLLIQRGTCIHNNEVNP